MSLFETVSGTHKLWLFCFSLRFQSTPIGATNFNRLVALTSSPLFALNRIFFFVSLSNSMVKSVLPKIRPICLSRHSSQSGGGRVNCHDTWYRESLSRRSINGDGREIFERILRISETVFGDFFSVMGQQVTAAEKVTRCGVRKC